MRGGALLGAVLAGGGSRRFGEDKTLARLDGKPLVRWAVESLLGACDAVTVVTGRSKVEHASGVGAITDRVAGLGPLGGLEAALSWAVSEHAPGVFLLGGDMPFVSPAVVEFVSGDRRRLRAARSAQGLEPLCAWYPASILSDVRQRIEDGDLAMMDLLTELRAGAVSLDDTLCSGDPGRVLWSIDTPAELVRAAALLVEEGVPGESVR